MKKLLLLTVLALLASAARADTTLKDDAAVWTPVFVQGPLKGPVLGYFEVNPRARGDFEVLSTLILRPALGVKLGEGLTAHAGYAWIRSDSGTRVTEEHRAWQQGQKVWTRDPAKYTLRARLEQRFLETDPETALRGRGLVRGDWKLPGSERWYALLSSETFVNLNTTRITRQGFEQHRAFVGLGYDYEAPVRIEAGYQNQYLQYKSGRQNIVHVLLVNTYFGPK